MLSRSYEDDFRKVYSIMAIRLWLTGGMTLGQARKKVAYVIRAQRLAKRALRRIAAGEAANAARRR